MNIPFLSLICLLIRKYLPDRYLILPAALGPGFYSVSNRKDCQKKKKKMFLGSRARLARKADNLTAISEPAIWTMWDLEHLNPIVLHSLLRGQLLNDS
jgi:hypothetical protein